MVTVKRGLSEAELLHVAIRARTMAEKRVPEEMKAFFRSLEDVTEVEEIRVETAWGSSRVYVVQEKEQGADKRPLLVDGETCRHRGSAYLRRENSF